MTGIKHALSEAASGDGHCYLPRDELLTRAAALLEVPLEALPPAPGGRCARRRKLFVEERPRLPRAVLLRRERARRAGCGCCCDAPSALPAVGDGEWEDVFAALERERGIRLAERQREAVRLAYHVEGDAC